MRIRKPNHRVYAACSLLEHMVAFSVLFNGLKPQKPLVVKLEKRNQNTFKGIT